MIILDIEILFIHPEFKRKLICIIDNPHSEII